MITAAAPLPSAFVACGGAVADDTARPRVDAGSGGSTGGAPVYVGTGGGYPVVTGTGGYPVVTGTGGYPVVTGTGGYPVVIGSTGAYPGYMGMGGSPVIDDGGSVNVSDGSASFPDACPAPVTIPLVEADAAATLADGALDCAALCGDARASCSIELLDGQTAVQCQPLCVARRPPGLADAALPFDHEVTRYFVEMARLECAAVRAFRVLGHELSLHGAPLALRGAARRAVRDEIRHTRMGKILAERFGGVYVPPRFEHRPLRTLEAIALDNAVEGCVRETFGAVIATWQSRAAADPVVRRVMRKVAVDETRHAGLALGIARWTHRRLGEAARRRVRDVRCQAAETLTRELECDPSPALAVVAGVPSRADARRLTGLMTKHLWA